MSDTKKNSFVECREEMGDKYLRNVDDEDKDYVERIILVYNKNGKICEYSDDKDILLDANNKICTYSGEIDNLKTPHGHGKLVFSDKSIIGNFYHGLPIDSSAILETDDFFAIANVLGCEIIEFEHIRFKKK